MHLPVSSFSCPGQPHELPRDVYVGAGRDVGGRTQTKVLVVIYGRDTYAVRVYRYTISLEVHFRPLDKL